MTIKHSPECTKAFEEAEKARAEYRQKWPNFCKNCSGWGGSYSTYDPSPAGVSLGSGFMYDYEPCGDCLEKGICPRCGKESKRMKKAMEEGTDDFTCEHCGWSEEEKTEGMPEEPECWCYYNEKLNPQFEEV